MKGYVTLIAAALLAAGCSSMQRMVTWSALDFRPYAEAGFSFYTGDCPVPHRQLGAVYVTILPGAAKPGRADTLGVKGGRFGDPVYSKGASSRGLEELGSRDLLDPVAAAVREMGGDAAARLEVSRDGAAWRLECTACQLIRD